MKHFTLIIFLIGAQLSYSQNFEWAESFGGLSTEQAISVVTDPNDQSIYLTGFFFSEFDGIPGTPNSNTVAVDATDLFLIKLDAQGDFVWMITVGGLDNQSGMGLIIDENQNILMLARESPNTSVYKFDANGSFVWYYVSGYANSTSPESISLDSEGNVYVSGTFSDTVDFDNSVVADELIAQGNEDAFILKLDTDGEYIWSKSIGGPSGGAIGKEISINSEDDIILSGFFHGTVDFDPNAGNENFTAFGSTDIFTTKLDSAGNHIWTMQTGGSLSNQVTGITLDGDDNIYSTGHFEGSMDADPSTNAEFLNTNGNFDFFVQKLNTDGEYLWAIGYGGMQYDIAKGICLDDDGEIYVTGNFGAAMDFDPGTEIYSLDAGVADDGFILKCSNDGDFIWARQIEGIDAFNTGIDIHVDIDENILVVGEYMGQTDFDPNSSDHYISSIDILDVFILKLNQDHSGIENIKEESYSIFPNPSQGVLSVEGEYQESGILYTLDGKVIETFIISEGKINLEHIDKGMYFLVIESSPGHLSSKKIVIE
ncbi:MAG: hypothetical protein ACI857_002455 [Arenicella sp.]|jgi:hypothetical protein